MRMPPKLRMKWVALPSTYYSDRNGYCPNSMREQHCHPKSAMRRNASAAGTIAPMSVRIRSIRKSADAASTICPAIAAKTGAISDGRKFAPREERPWLALADGVRDRAGSGDQGHRTARAHALRGPSGNPGILQLDARVQYRRRLQFSCRASAVVALAVLGHCGRRERGTGALACAYAAARLAHGVAAGAGDRWRAGQSDRPPARGSGHRFYTSVHWRLAVPGVQRGRFGNQHRCRVAGDLRLVRARQGGRVRWLAWKSCSPIRAVFAPAWIAPSKSSSARWKPSVRRST